MISEDTWHIRQFNEKDLPEIIAIEQASHPDPWSKQMLLDSCSGDGYLGLIAVDGDDIPIGYCCSRLLVDEMEIVNLAVSPVWRRKGIGLRLIESLVFHCRNHAMTRLLLEVRESNATALSLYKKSGFSKVGIRKKYYSDGSNAVLMSLSLNK